TPGRRSRRAPARGPRLDNRDRPATRTRRTRVGLSAPQTPIYASPMPRTGRLMPDAPLPAQAPAASAEDEWASIPAEAPTAPTEEAWARMSPEQRERAVEALLASESLEEIAKREAMAEGDPHLDAKMNIRDTLRAHFGKLGRKIYVGADITVYYPGKKGFTPDVLAVNEVNSNPRDCWMV